MTWRVVAGAVLYLDVVFCKTDMMRGINSFAVCIAGEPRTALSIVVLESFQKRVLAVLKSAGGGAMVDVHMTSVFGQGSKGGSSDAALLIATLEKEYRPTSHRLMNASDTWRAFANFRCPHGIARFGHNSQGTIHSWRNAELVLVQWVAIRACYEQVEAHERASGFRYAWIMRTRHDLAYLDDLPVAQLKQSSAFMPYGLVPCHNDHLFLCPREMCRPYFTLLELFESKHCVRQLATATPGARPSLRGPFASGDPLLPHGMTGPPAEPFALPEQPDGVDQQWYVLARYTSSGRICGASDVLPECCGAPLLQLFEWPYAIARGNTASGYLDDCGTLGIATSGRDTNKGSTSSHPLAQQAYTSARLPPRIEARVAATYKRLRAECDALASRWVGNRAKRDKPYHTAYTMNLAGKLTPQDSPGDKLFTAWRCADYTPAQWWRKACKKWYDAQHA